MRKLIIIIFIVLCACINSFADGKLPKLLIDGCFFNEMPSDVDGKQIGVIILSDQDGNKIMAIKGVKLSDDAKRYAVKKEDVPNADYWIKQAETKEDMAMKMVYNVSRKTKIAEGDTIGQFCVKDVAGRVWDNASTKGRVLVINFWYTGCGPCIREMPEISKWKDECPDANFLAVTYNSFDEIKDIVERQNFRFTQVVGDRTLWEMFMVQQTPTTVLIDKDGVVRKLTIGTNGQKRHDMLQAIKKVSAAQ